MRVDGETMQSLHLSGCHCYGVSCHLLYEKLGF